MTILAIDTSSRACVLGLRTTEKTWFDETILDRTHSKEILPRIDALLKSAAVAKSEIDLIVYGQGPGSFTGLRIGVGVVQGLAFGLDTPVVGVSSLACLAQRQWRENGAQHVIVAMTARHTEVYFGAYAVVNNAPNSVLSNIVQLQGREGVYEAAEIPAQDAKVDWVGVGGGWQLDSLLTQASGVTVGHISLEEYPQAIDLLDLGEAYAAQGLAKTAPEALPEYLREQVAKKLS
ncbi:MAG: tRNA threonylcarbamoyladenosine biosynthesis protein TsaB [Candidatus Azotimanducaceae bacterium]|jgi:tRNA threonylcarbamoyladenosine biosynthesis protein TsaB